MDEKATKIKGVFTQIALVCRLLSRVARQRDQNTISISFIPSSDVLNPKLDQLDQSYMYTQILKEILLEMKYHDELSIKNMVAYCRENYIDNYAESSVFNKFEQEYHLQSPIWWYTSEYFIYSMLNQALRNQDIDTIVGMGFFLRDLHRNIEQLHSEQMNDQNIRSLTVYRGQGLSKEDFEKMIKAKGGIMSFNNFLSTSTGRDVTFLFADSIQSTTDLIGVFFEMTIDTSISSTPFADLNNVGQFNDQEKEILFSMHTVFRIHDIERICNNNRFWRVKLTLTNDNDKELSAVTGKIREETQGGSTGIYRLGKFLLKLGEYSKAKELYEALLDFVFDDVSKGYLYHQLGFINHHEGHYLEAISWYEKSVEIHQRIRSPSDFDMTSFYNNIGLVYYDTGEYSKALILYKKALEIQQKVHPLDDFTLAIIYNNIGLVYDNMDDCSEAFEYYEKSLEINQRILPSNHPSLAGSYNNIGLVSHKMGEYAKALSFYDKGLKICQSV